jgi:hypothetical protein
MAAAIAPSTCNASLSATSIAAMCIPSRVVSSEPRMGDPGEGWADAVSGFRAALRRRIQSFTRPSCRYSQLGR